jgi:hypothetical protein
MALKPKGNHYCEGAYIYLMQNSADDSGFTKTSLI